ncbi:MAG: DNA-directed RNA polymerase subunit beta' [Erysipelotrichaceae bacterium]|nr:DNA-directed RNA polymerase subunit beta' [Erysipelotrichaceae bacterium]
MNINDVASIQIGLASPERILEWSHGEVKKPETLNYRSQKPERDGLFCEKIFGPTKDWECACGKYKKVRYKGVVCDRCGVEITRRAVRRERMGHIQLASPVTHIWYLKGTPSRLALLLNIPPKELEEIVYFVKWIVTDPKDSGLEYKQVMTPKEVNEALDQRKFFTAKIGAEAIKTLLEQVDIEQEYQKITAEIGQLSDTDSQNEKRKKLIKRLETVAAFRNSGQKPEWMVLTVLPVIPPDLRPMLQLDGGRFASSDLNDLYRRIITRNNRLNKLLEIGTPSIIVQNEKRMLQEAVDALIDNGRRSKPVTGSNNRALKSLSHSLKGKQGRFRQNLLGKRVDFSGRSVIAVGPDLKMYQCGLPREMAIVLFRPFVINEMVHQEIATNSKTAEKLIDKGDDRVWDILEEVIKDHPVLLNRAPTLHRLGIQAFMPKLVEGRAIRLHPLVCPAFNADFDGDQMAVHVPLSEEACAEAKILMLGSNNILSPKDGQPIVTPSQDMVLGNFYLTMEETREEFYEEAERYRSLGDEASAELWTRYGDSEGRVYKDVDEVLMAYDEKQTHLHTRIALRAKSLKKTFFTEEQNEKYLITTVGKIIFNNVFPSDFPYVNEVKDGWNIKLADKYFVDYGTDIKEYIRNLPLNSPVKKKDLGAIIAEVYKRYANTESHQAHDDGKPYHGEDQTFVYFDKIKDNGFKYSTVAGMTISLNDIRVSPNKHKYVEEGKVQAERLLRLYHRGLLTEPEWERSLMALWDGIKTTTVNELMADLPKKNPINMMMVSGARGNKDNLSQLAGLRGLMSKPTQAKSAKGYQRSIIEVPIYSCFREGQTVNEFFIASHGIRKGLTDTALKTASSGYLTRRLVDVAQDVVVVEDDCYTEDGYLVSDIVDRKAGTVIETLYERLVGRYSKQDIVDPETGELIVADDEFIDENKAQRIVAAGYKEVLIRNAFVCKSENGICRKCYGRNMATGKLVENGEAVGIMAAQSIGEPGTQLTMRNFHTGGVANAEGDITQGLPRVEELFEARCPKHPAVIARFDGEVVAIAPNDKGGTTITLKRAGTNEEEAETFDHKVDPTQVIRSWIKVGTFVQAGDKLTEGQVNPKELIDVAGVEAVQNYILKEVKKVYHSQSIDISDKHLEIMITQMLRKVIIEDGRDTELAKGTQISKRKITELNGDVLLNGGMPAKFKPILLGVSKSSVETDSWLSAASFQETTKVLTDAAVNGKIDVLRGLKENVIIGKKIPAGTGTDAVRESTIEIKRRAEEARRLKAERLAQESEEESRLQSLVAAEGDNRDFDADIAE